MPARVQVPRFRFERELAAFLCLLTLLGGPIALAELAEPTLGRSAAFALGFAPVGLLFLGMQSVYSRDRGALSRALIVSGVVGAFAVLGFNSFALIMLLRGAPLVAPPLILFGVIAGSIVALRYIPRVEPALARRYPREDPRPFPGPGAADWTRLLVSAAALLATLALIPSVGSTPPLLFATALLLPCVGVTLAVVLRKRRYTRPPSRQAFTSLLGGRRLYARADHLIVIAFAWMGLAGLIALTSASWSDARLYAPSLAVLGGLALLAVLSGSLRARSLLLTPAGLVVGARAHELLIPWSSVAELRPGELYLAPALWIRLTRPARLDVRPPSARPQVAARLRSDRALGFDMVLVTSRFGVELPALLAALERARRDPSARAAFAPRQRLRRIAEPRAPGPRGRAALARRLRSSCSGGASRVTC